MSRACFAYSAHFWASQRGEGGKIVRRCSAGSDRCAVGVGIAIVRHVGESWREGAYDMLYGIPPARLRSRRHFHEEGFQDGAKGDPSPERTLELGFRGDGITQRLEVASVRCECRERDDHGCRRKQVSTAYARFDFAQQERDAMADQFRRLPTA